MSNEWDEYATDWDNNNDVISYADKAFTSLLNTIDITGLRIFDFGCGTGLLTERLSPLAGEIVALDSSEKMISVLVKKSLPNVTTLSDVLSERLITTHSALSEKFDLIVASSVCSFLPDFEQMLALLMTLLKPGGMFVQWDWLATEGSEFGLSQDAIESAYNKVGIRRYSIKQAFTFKGNEGEMDVLMGIAINSDNNQ